ncbi:MAG: hypothetical protein ACYCP1_01510 [Thermoplasmataceae archaeon]
MLTAGNFVDFSLLYSSGSICLSAGTLIGLNLWQFSFIVIVLLRDRSGFTVSSFSLEYFPKYPSAFGKEITELPMNYGGLRVALMCVFNGSFVYQPLSVNFLFAFESLSLSGI